MKFRALIPLAKETYGQWSAHKSARLAAALAYYTVFSLAPLLIILIAVAGLFFGHEAAQGQLIGHFQSVMGHQGGQAVQGMIAGASKPKAGIIATILGVAALVFGASGVIIQLQDALNTVWDAEPKKAGGFLAMLRQRFLSFSMILALAFLLLVSLVVSSALSALNTYTMKLMPALGIALQVGNVVFDFAILSALFALIYKYLPEADVAWRDVWIGAALTAVLFLLGQLALELYIGKSSVTSTYGAAGSLVAVLLWVYYAAQILLLGAEFTRVYAGKQGSRKARNRR